jgi:hypothetical protein
MAPTAEHLDALWSFVDLPEWLGEFLEDCASRLLGVPMKEESRTPHVQYEGHRIAIEIDMVTRRPEIPAKTGEGAGAIGRAVGFSEGLAKARQHWGGPFDRNENRAAAVVDVMWNEGISLDAAAEKLEHSKFTGYNDARVAFGDDAKWPERRSIRRFVEGAQRWVIRTMQERLREATGTVPERHEIVNVYSDFCRTRNLTEKT